MWTSPEAGLAGPTSTSPHAPLPSRTQSLPSVQRFPPSHTTLQRTSTTANVSLPPPKPSTFSYRHYCPAPEVVYTTSLEEADELLSRLHGPVLGFDMEWPYTFDWHNKKKVNEKHGKTALIQVCDKRLIVLIHLKAGNNMRLPPKLIDIMQDPKIYKCGVQVRGDGIKLWLDFPGAFPNGIKSLLELNNIARCVDGDNAFFKDKPVELVGLKAQTLVYLGKNLDKSNNERQSNWARGLSQRQIEYAANDAYAGLNIYFHLANLARDQSLRLLLDNCSNNISSDGNHYRGLEPDSRLGVRHALRNNDNDGGFLPEGLYGCEHADNLDGVDDGSDAETEVDEGEEREEEGVDRRKRRKVGSREEGPEGTEEEGRAGPAGDADAVVLKKAGAEEAKAVRPRTLAVRDSGVDVGQAERPVKRGIINTISDSPLLGGWSLEELEAAAAEGDPFLAEDEAV